MTKAIYFDMDGTIANLYGVDNWLDYLAKYDSTPYEVAKPMLNMSVLARILNRLQRKGYIIGIISWLSKTSTPEYDEKVRQAKTNWLKKHIKSVKFDSIQIVYYGTPKYTLGKGILFDDEIKNRDAWGENAYDVDNILGVLKTL